MTPLNQRSSADTDCCEHGASSGGVQRRPCAPLTSQKVPTSWPVCVMPWSSVAEALGPSTGTTTNSVDQARGMSNRARLSATTQDRAQGRDLGCLVRRASLTRTRSAGIDTASRSFTRIPTLPFPSPRNCTRLGGLVQSFPWCPGGSLDEDPSVVCRHTPPPCHTLPGHSSRQPAILTPDLTWLKGAHHLGRRPTENQNKLGRTCVPSTLTEFRSEGFRLRALRTVGATWVVTTLVVIVCCFN